MNEPTPALDRQIGGDHYKKLAIQPVVYCHRNNICLLYTSDAADE